MRLTRALALFALALSACADASAGGFPWKRPIVAAGGGGGGSPTNVRRFGSGELTLSGGAVDYSVGSVSVGDLVVVGTQGFFNVGTAVPTIAASGTGNTATATVTSRQSYINGTYGSAALYDLAITGAGTLVLQISAGGGESSVFVVGTQWGGTTFTYDTGGVGSPNGGTNGGFSSITAASITISANRLIVGYFGGGGVVNVSSGAATVPGGYGSQNGSGAGVPLTIVDQLVSTTTQPSVSYGSFAYGCGLDVAYSY